MILAFQLTAVLAAFSLAGCSGMTNPVPPLLSVQPANAAVNAGQTATFVTSATGTSPISYQWRKNGANIPGAMASSYTTPTTTLADNGAKFDVVVSNRAGSVTSSPPTLTVHPPPMAPTITTQPPKQKDITVQPPQFPTTPTTSPPPSYPI